jgi:hypothetical protein
MKSKTLSGIKDQIMKKFVDITAVVIATIAVVVSINQANTQKKLEIINKQPLLNIEFIKADSEIEKGFVLRNVGFGPAIIKSFRFYNNQEDYEKNISYHEWLDTNGNSRFPLNLFLEI